MSKLVFRVKNAPDSLPSVNIVDELDSVNPPNAYLVGLNASNAYSVPNGAGFQIVWDSDGEISTVHISNNSTTSFTATTLSSGAEKIINASTLTVKQPASKGGSTVSNVKGFVMLSVGSLTDAEVVSILNNESGISGVQAAQVMHEDDGWWIWSNPTFHNPGIDNFAIVYLLSSQVS